MVDRKIDPFLFMRPDDKERMQMLIKQIKKEKEMSQGNKKGDNSGRKNEVQSGKRWVDTKGLMQYLGRAKPTIYEWVHLGKIKAHRIPGSRLLWFNLDEIDAMRNGEKEKPVDNKG